MELIKTKQMNIKKLSKHYLLMNILLVIIATGSYLGENIYKNKRKFQTMNTLIPGTVVFQYLITMIYLFTKYQLIDSVYKKKFKNTFIFLLTSGFLIMITAISVGGGVFKFKVCAKVFSVAFLAWLLTLVSGNLYNRKILESK